MRQEIDEVLACVDKTGEITGEFVNRKDFYEGKCPNKRICGVVFWIFDKEGNVLLTERGAEKEQGAGKITPPSGHVQFKRETDEKERPMQACFNEIEEELGLFWNYKNFPFTDEHYPVGVIQRPKGSAENCEMIVKHYALLLGDGVKQKIKNNEAKRIFFESWNTAVEKFGIDDNTSGEYQFFGTNKEKILYELDRFVYKINNLDKLGPNATWDTIALNDLETVNQYRKDIKSRPECRKGYVTWEIISSIGDLWYLPGAKSVIFDIITVREDVKYENMKKILLKITESVITKLEDAIDKIIKGEHTIDDFSEVIATQSEIKDIVRMTRMVIKYTNNQKDDYTK